jgi:hypothetical protein
MARVEIASPATAPEQIQPACGAIAPTHRLFGAEAQADR